MFEDRRSRQILLVAHCVLNQNAKIDRCACYPGAIQEVSHYLIDSGVGLVQMPCPELRCLGLDRQAEPGSDTTVESEDTRVAQRMLEGSSAALCSRMVNDLIDQIQEYQKNAFQFLGVVGINGSPTCGVETSWSHDREVAGPGVFIRMLAEGCRRRGIGLTMKGIKARDIQPALAAVRRLVEGTPGRG